MTFWEGIGIGIFIVGVLMLLSLLLPFTRDWSDKEIITAVVTSCLVMVIGLVLAIIISTHEEEITVTVHQCHFTGQINTEQMPMITIVNNIPITNFIPVTEYLHQCNDGNRWLSGVYR